MHVLDVLTRQDAELAGKNASALPKQDTISTNVASARPHVLPGFRGFEDVDEVAVSLRILLNHDGIRAWWQRGSREDSTGGPRPELGGKRSAGP